MSGDTLRRTLVCMAAAFGLRLALWVRLSCEPSRFLVPDSVSYEIPAANLVDGYGFSGSLKPPFAPETFRTPGYPVFLAAHRLAAASDRWPALTQSVLDALTAGLAAACAAVLAPGSWAWIAAAFYGLEPVAAAHAPLILSEPLFGFVMTLALLLLLLSGPDGRLGPAAGAGICLGLATIVRPIALYLPWVMLPFLLAAWRRTPRATAVFLLSAALLPGLWIVRNTRVLDRAAFCTVSGNNLLYYDAPAVLAAATGRPAAEVERDLRARFESDPSIASANPFDRSAREATFARPILAAHPFAFLRLHLVTGLKTLLGPGTDLIARELFGAELGGGEERAHAVSGRGTFGLLARHPILWLPAIFDALLLAAAYVLAVRGAMFLARRGTFWWTAWLVPLVYLTALSTGGWAYYRFRAPLWPLFSALAAVGLVAQTSRQRV